MGVGIRYLSEIGPTPPPLHPSEEGILGPRAVAGRQALFALGRAAGRDALRELGFEHVGIGRGEGGQPLWPSGVVGAISHSSEIAVALVGLRNDYVGLGVDVEDPARDQIARAARLVCRPAEMAWVHAEADTRRLTMLFSAKETIFKALYPIERVWFGFEDAELTWFPQRGAFKARVLKSVGDGYPVGFELDVNCTVGSGWVLSTAFVPAGGVPWRT
ncbi:MAG: 4'-phosphopantetheinyl transferase superfamily protein [Chloroflexi bacterium]|nr:4'-phosphopantetheinyl transferase superfamily protein [Chloroflexota bacterium]MBV9599389.1 4'-phosphopantetheinyl transferase superfamily protein [Chloroflexota bacterium]